MLQVPVRIEGVRLRLRRSTPADAEATFAIFRDPDVMRYGCIGCRITGHAADFGYFLARAHWGQGYATEAAGLLVRWLRRQGRIVRIGATTDIDNTASAAVLLKLGLQREGVMRKATVRPNLNPDFGSHIGSAPRDTVLFASVKPDESAA